MHCIIVIVIVCELYVGIILDICDNYSAYVACWVDGTDIQVDEPQLLLS